MNWLLKIAGQDKIAQATYPGGQGWQAFNYQGRLDTWGYDPVFKGFNYHRDLGDFIRSPYLMRIPAKHIALTIDHLVDKYLPETEPHVLATTQDWCEGPDESWAWKACSCARGTNQWHTEPQEDDNDMCWQGGDQCGSVSLGRTLKQLDTEIDQIAANFAQRYEVPEKEFIQNMAAFIEMEVVTKIGLKTQATHKDQTFFVRVYGQNKAYGGAEEGGWWYDDKQLLEEEKIQGLTQACQRKAQLQAQYEGKGKDTFLDDMANLHGGIRDAYDEDTSGDMGMGDVGYGVNEVEGVEFPVGWTPSAFEKFIVQVELAEQPISQTQGIPRYSNKMTQWLQKFAQHRIDPEPLIHEALRWWRTNWQKILLEDDPEMGRYGDVYKTIEDIPSAIASEEIASKVWDQLPPEQKDNFERLQFYVWSMLKEQEDDFAQDMKVDPHDLGPAPTPSEPPLSPPEPGLYYYGSPYYR